MYLNFNISFFETIQFSVEETHFSSEKRFGNIEETKRVQNIIDFLG